jgi:hypothetical protein
MTEAQVAEAVAVAFSQRLRQCLTPAEWMQMVVKNATNPLYANGACASQDYCDANMPMGEAFLEVVGHEVDGDSAEDAAIWNAAWDRARAKWQKASGTAMNAAPHTDDLCDCYDAFIDVNGFEPPMSADELLAELWQYEGETETPLIKDQKRWLSHFIKRWEELT